MRAAFCFFLFLFYLEREERRRLIKTLQDRRGGEMEEKRWWDARERGRENKSSFEGWEGKGKNESKVEISYIK